MFFDLPDTDTLYAALLARDDRYDGRAFVGVSSTGVFCRLTCPARKPKAENCTFYASPGACIAAGFRPCKRCHPLGPAAQSDPVVATLVAALDARPDLRWSESDVQAMGHDPSTVRRAFKRHFGMTFLEMARHRRLADGFDALSKGDSVTLAQIDAGFSSASGFRTAFARLLGRAPGSFAKSALLRADWIDTPLGPMIAIASANHLHLLEFTNRRALGREVRALEAQNGTLGLGSFAPTDQIRTELDAFFAGRSARFDTPLAPLGGPFAQEVWTHLRRIPAGQTRSYSQIAHAMNRPTATRAVARANGANPIALVIPCHRVLGADGSLTGYGGGLWRKQRLIEIESAFRAAPHDPKAGGPA